MRSYRKSNELFDKTLKRIPLASQTFSKSHIQHVKGASPLFLTHGKGSHVWDVDENEYIDFINGLLPVILGYCDADVDTAVLQQLEKGVSFSLATGLELELAEKLARLIPCAEMTRYGKNGTDVTSAAIRLCRAITGRDHVAVCGYHGWQDWYIGSTTRNKGVPQAVRDLTHPFKYNDLPSLESVLKSHEAGFAAVILEPAGVGTPAEGFLQGVRDLTHSHGTLLVFDEIITGFRWHLGGAQSLYGVTPDLATFGKSMGNGFPISALVGHAEYMEKIEEIFYSGTFAGETLSLAASLATIKKLEKENVPETLWNKGKFLVDRLNQLIGDLRLRDLLKIRGNACWPILEVMDHADENQWVLRSFIRQELAEAGMLVLASHNLSHAHSEEDLSRLIDAYQNAFSKMKEGLEKKCLKKWIRGEVIRPVFQVR